MITRKLFRSALHHKSEYFTVELIKTYKHEKKSVLCITIY